jgi:hypothetical protein
LTIALNQTRRPAALDNAALQCKVYGMETNWAVENLQTIRTLMERSAVYRRALAPIMLFAGAVGTAAAAVGLLFHLDSVGQFIGLWFGTAACVIAGVLLIVRRQALKDNEAFWTPPTRRVTQALLPPLTAGMLLGAICLLGVFPPEFLNLLSILWAVLYGCALHAAGFFVPRGIKLLGWIFISGAFTALFVELTMDLTSYYHWFMGFFFGLLHLVYGAYLYLSERGKNAA